MRRLAGSVDQVIRLPQSQLGRNILSNYAAALWLGVLSLALMPLYLRLLGPNQWGLVAMCMSMQALMSLLDAGLGQIMPRDVARVASRPTEVARVFHLFSRVYLALAVAGMLVGQVAIPWVASRWIHAGGVAASDVMPALRLVLLQFFFQFANSAHVGYWNGMQAQGLANLRQCTFATAKHALAMVAIVAWRADALSYLWPFVAVSAIEYLANGHSIRHNLDQSVRPRVTQSDLRALVADVGWLAAGVLVGMLVSQVDRIALARAVDIAAFGRYVIATNLGLALMQLQQPLIRAFFPRIVQARGQADLVPMRGLTVGIVALCVVPCALTALFAPEILRLWTRDPIVVAEGTTPLRFVLGAVAINAMYQVTYQRLLSSASTRVIFRINIVVLAVTAPLAGFATDRFGAAGAGFIWLAASTIQLLAGLLAARGSAQ